MKITENMKKIFFFLATICVAACKKEPDLPADPHVPLVNPFTGVWKAGGEYWQFRSDGTGGRAAIEKGPFPDEFSFFVYAGQDVRAAPSEGSLVILDDSNNDVMRYIFSIEQNQATLTLPSSPEPSFTLERVSGAPRVLSLKNQLIGEWSADWTGIHSETNPGSIKWSFKYRADGTVKTYHHGLHQFENGYALRGDILVIFGAWRFSIEPVTANIYKLENGTWQITETQLYPQPVEWSYTKVTAAEWKE
jgi:hypothetical protein